MYTDQGAMMSHRKKDIYADLRSIEERGMRIKENRKPFLNFFRNGRKERKADHLAHIV